MRGIWAWWSHNRWLWNNTMYPSARGQRKYTNKMQYLLVNNWPEDGVIAERVRQNKKPKSGDITKSCNNRHMLYTRFCRIQLCLTIGFVTLLGETEVEANPRYGRRSMRGSVQIGFTLTGRGCTPRQHLYLYLWLGRLCKLKKKTCLTTRSDTRQNYKHFPTFRLINFLGRRCSFLCRRVL